MGADEFNKLQAQSSPGSRGAKKIGVCGGAGCRALGGEAVFEALVGAARDASDDVRVFRSGCQGLCQAGPAVLTGENFFFQKTKPEDAQEIVAATIDGVPLERLLGKNPITGEALPGLDDIPFFAGQERNVLRFNGQIDPDSFEDYVAVGGYRAFIKALSSISPDEIIEMISESGLRGRGGAGYTVGAKWAACRVATGEPKYVIANRSGLDGVSHLALEGILIGAYAVGAGYGYVYIREQNPSAIAQMENAISQARAAGLLGENIQGSGFDFDLSVWPSTGAFIAGEETAMIASIEGDRAVPRVRPPYPSESGLWGRPTLINNAETFANVPGIIDNGPEWFRKIGVADNPGTKVFSLTGQVVNGGLVELALGTTVEQAVFEVGGGIPGDRNFKGLNIGGPSGGVVPASGLDLPLTYDAIAAVGGITGNGDLSVLDETTCMVETARSFMELMADESCGKCAPCRIGTRRMLEILNRITAGTAAADELETLEKLALTVKETSLCGLGKTAPNPVLTTIEHFRDEYEAHIAHHKCAAARCPELVKAPCSHTCPAEVDAPTYIALIAQGRYKEAVEIHKERNPFPSICGRVCHHPCETRCRRGQIDEPIAICQLKRFMADQAPDALPAFRSSKENIDHRVAVVGAGPAGLSCAFYLALVGYDVTVFESLSVVGGMMKVGIPDFRLPEAVLGAEIDAIRAAGVKIETEKSMGVDFTIDTLKADGFQAIFLGTGAHRGNNMGLDGEAELEGVADGATFLRHAALGDPVALGKKVVVIGGGNVAIDAARTALRSGAEEVKIVYRRTESEMPAYEWDIREAREEGIRIDFLVAPTEFTSENGRVTGVRCQRMKLGDRDKQGRRRPVPVEGSDFIEIADTVIGAIGQKPDLDYLSDREDLITSWGRLAVSGDTLMSETPGVFGGGDAVSGPASVVEAVAHGQRSAIEIERFITGSSLVQDQLDKNSGRSIEPLPEEAVEAAGTDRRVAPEADPVSRRRDFTEVVQALSEEAARGEAGRCLRCDLDED